MITKEDIVYAKSLLDAPGIVQIFQALEDRYTEAWKGSVHTDAATREDAYYMIRALLEIKNELQTIAKSEDIARFNSRLAKTNNLR